MNWSSVKNLLIAILVAANLFLIYNIALQNRTNGYIDENEVRNAVSLLAERGLSVDISCVPLRRFNANIYESPYGDNYFEAAAEALSGAARENRTILPDGGLLIVTKNGDSFEFDNELGFIYNKNSNIPAASYTNITADNFSEFAKSCIDVSKSRLKKLTELAGAFLNAGIPTESLLGIRVDGGVYDEQSGLYYLLAVQLIDGIPISRHNVVCVFMGDTLIASSGHWYFFGLETSYNEELFDQVNILFTDLDTLENYRSSLSENSSDEAEPLPGVSSVSACYAAYWNSDITALYFMPAWQIEHTDGTLIVYNAADSAQYFITR
ncbi:MAG: hypothetical protein HFE63_06075 [Clostridiales bacterium]|nr:hypothetical protein [Clostridiales bacterium]